MLVLHHLSFFKDRDVNMQSFVHVLFHKEAKDDELPLILLILIFFLVKLVVGFLVWDNLVGVKTQYNVTLPVEENILVKVRFSVFLRLFHFVFVLVSVGDQHLLFVLNQLHIISEVASLFHIGVFEYYFSFECYRHVFHLKILVPNEHLDWLGIIPSYITHEDVLIIVAQLQEAEVRVFPVLVLSEVSVELERLRFLNLDQASIFVDIPFRQE